MFAISLAYPLGRVHAAEAGEPPAWSRLYSALIAAAYRGNLMSDVRDALLWLESVGPPAIADSPSARDEPSARYVPANDDARPPRQRHRTARTFETAVLADRECDFQYIWKDAEPNASLRTKLDAICAAVTHVGTTHSIALVSVVENPRTPDWEPAQDRADLSLRTVLPGRLDESDRVFAEGRRLHGGACETWTAYRAVRPLRVSDHGRLLALSVHGDLSGEHAIHLSTAILAALQAEIPDDELESAARGVHGHGAEAANRLRILPAPDVGHRHASGRILGVFIDMPDPAMRPSVLSALSRLDSLLLPGDKRITLSVPAPGLPLPHALQERTWIQPSREWTTALAAILDRFPKRGLDLEQIVRMSCQHAGLPPPRAIHLAQHGFLQGVDHAQRYTMRDKQRGPRTHLLLQFDEPVSPAAPLSLGRSRNYGLGLLRPLNRQEGARNATELP
ncbi:type I-U CRISPR-associated protein Csb2 [Azoarcus sp. DN11]|uniref:type I-G CRISPR-associated protein Csb2 n=1 Tax=Azoarcus sp. DN11 TaxID=356837 RepID=UPI000EABA5B6|nr:type I-U CRISPR-associated protein Csb2 [Azoarcus sp. DN11]AYH45779.1 type I-U CRISPR-associated protein Cas5/Cas6 [Azoarcus sp. DN11]